MIHKKVMNIIGRAADIQCKIEEREREKGTGNDRPSIATNDGSGRLARVSFTLKWFTAFFLPFVLFSSGPKPSRARRPSLLGASEYVNRRFI